MRSKVHHCQAIELLKNTESDSVDLIYTDPPFGTGNVQRSLRKKGKDVVSDVSYVDAYKDYKAFLFPHIVEAHRVLKQSGTMYLHLDWRWVHYAKVWCDEIFGYDNFLNELIWSYNFGGRGKKCFPQKHDTILVYTKEFGKHVFNWDDIDRIPYAAPEMQSVGRTPEEAAVRVTLGQVPTDVWSMSIVGTNSKERLGYPNQKPRKLIERAILASSQPDSVVMDFFAGSGTTGAAALVHGRSFILSDASPDAISTMKERFKDDSVDFV